MRARLGLALATLAALTPAVAADAPAVVDIAYLALAPKQAVAASALDPPPAHEGVLGARLALADDQTTGRFLHQDYHLDEVVLADAAGVTEAARRLAAAGHRIIVTDLPAASLLQGADLPELHDALLLDATCFWWPAPPTPTACTRTRCAARRASSSCVSWPTSRGLSPLARNAPTPAT